MNEFGRSHLARFEGLSAWRGIFVAVTSKHDKDNSAHGVATSLGRVAQKPESRHTVREGPRARTVGRRAKPEASKTSSSRSSSAETFSENAVVQSTLPPCPIGGRLYVPLIHLRR